MTAALTTAVARGIGVEDTLRLAWAAGAANVIRRGLGSANPELIETLATRVEVSEAE
jgi:1-phosphofructokinase